MKSVAIYKNGQQLFNDVKIADNFFARLKGLMFTKKMDKKDGLIIRPCKQVHTFFMRYNIDVLFLSYENKIIDIYYNMEKDKISKLYKDADYVLELPMGKAKEYGLRVGDFLRIG